MTAVRNKSINILSEMFTIVLHSSLFHNNSCVVLIKFKLKQYFFNVCV